MGEARQGLPHVQQPGKSSWTSHTVADFLTHSSRTLRHNFLRGCVRTPFPGVGSGPLPNLPPQGEGICPLPLRGRAREGAKASRIIMAALLYTLSESGPIEPHSAGKRVREDGDDMEDRLQRDGAYSRGTLVFGETVGFTAVEVYLAEARYSVFFDKRLIASFPASDGVRKRLIEGARP